MAQKVVLITGGSRGIGAACARRFAAGGCKVVLLPAIPAAGGGAGGGAGRLGGAGRRVRPGAGAGNG